MSHDHDHAHEHDDEDDVDISEWARSASTQTCPACGAPGAVQLGGGIFCPTCREITTSPGYQGQPGEA